MQAWGLNIIVPNLKSQLIMSKIKTNWVFHKSVSDNIFQTGNLKTNLKRHTLSGGIVTITSQSIKFCIQVGQTIILARLLTPADYGLFGMVTAITGFIYLFKDLGLSMSTIQRAEINHSQVSTLFWINVLLGVVVMLLTVAFAPAIAWFYKEPRIIGITLALASIFIFSGLTVQHYALLIRQMRFFTISIIEISSLLVGVGTAIVAARYGAGYWALVFMQLAMSITTAIGVWAMCGWYPGLPVRYSGVRSMLTFGGNLTIFHVLNYLARNLDNVLIGSYCGAQQLGFYAKSYQLFLLPLQQINAPITRVAIPALSRLQDEPERFSRYFCSAMSLMAFVITPLIAVMIALADEIILTVLGPQWIETSTIFKVLVLGGIMQPFGSATGWVFISLGQTRRLMQWALISVPLYILSFIIGIRWGAIGVAWSYTICVYLLIFPLFFFAFKYSPIRVGDLIKSTWRPMVISLAMYIVITQTHFYLTALNPLWILFVSCIIGFIILILFIMIWPKARFEALKIIEIAKILKESNRQ
jgi:O-antigen/teichoic acid export membrane protein